MSALLVALEDGASGLFAAFLLGGSSPVRQVSFAGGRVSARTAEQLHAEAAARDPAAVRNEVVVRGTGPAGAGHGHASSGRRR